MMKPILFKTEMIKAILDGRKTVTKRIVKKDISNQFDIDVDGKAFSYESPNIGMHYNPIYLAPYYKDDILYVRETWCHGWTVNDFVFKSTVTKEELKHVYKWHPSIHMPKEAARIFLKVTNVRVERLQEITEEQAEKEGTEPVKDALNNIYSQDGDSIGYRLAFEDLWNGTIKKEDIDKYGWDANPWVWVIEFERVDNHGQC